MQKARLIHHNAIIPMSSVFFAFSLVFPADRDQPRPHADPGAKYAYSSSPRKPIICPFLDLTENVRMHGLIGHEPNTDGILVQHAHSQLCVCVIVTADPSS
jgi:hypothetical protein